MLILGIESSCDETAAAVLRDGKFILSNAIASQIAIHKKYGGVVPELASRHHLENIVPIVNAALSEARITATQLDGIAVTQGPGLVGSLLVGVNYAKALSFSLNKPLVAVNHLEGHIYSVPLELAWAEQPRVCRSSRRAISAAMPSGLGIAVYQSFQSSPSRVAATRPSW